jgi:ADP-ribose pyrophosphatase YjhB (NUDIX family)
MDPSRIRPIAICLFRHGNRMLVSEGFDRVKQSYYCRPLGGGIEFGESSRAAIVREIREEVGVEIENLQLLGVLENIFMYEGQPGHEIVFVFDAEFADKMLYESEELDCDWQEEGIWFKAKWKSVAEIAESNMRLVPEALAQFLDLATPPHMENMNHAPDDL